MISALHGFLFSILILFSKSKKKRSLLFINLLVLSISLNNIQSWFLTKELLLGGISLDYLQLPWHFLIAPFFYLFLINYLNITKNWQVIIRTVGSIFGLMMIIRFGLVVIFVTNSSEIIMNLLRKYALIEELISVTCSTGVFAYAYHIYRKTISKNLSSNILTFDNLGWIHNFFIFGLLAYILWIIPLFIAVSLGFNIVIYSYYPLRVFTTILIYWLGYQSLIQLKISQERRYLRQKLNSVDQEYSKSKNTIDATLGFKNNGISTLIPKETITHILEGLTLFEKQKNYASQDISLNTLAKSLQTNTRYLSKIINIHKNTSYSKYINTLRINNIAKELEIDPHIRKFTIEAIAKEAGFNTANSFSKAFITIKKIKPSEYIRQLQKAL